MNDRPVIDYWVNLFTPKHLHDLYYTNPELTRLVNWLNLHDRVKGHEPDEFLEIMDEHGVDKIVIPSFKMWSFRDQYWMWHKTTEEVHDLIKDYPGRMYGMEGINPQLGLEGLRQLERAVTEFGFVGAHYHAYGYDIAIDDPRLWPYYAKCAELDVPVVMQIGHSAEKMPSETARPILLDRIAIHFPELRIVAAHTGWPWIDELVAMAWKHENVYVGTSAHAPKYWGEELVKFINGRGRGKVLFGSDFPVVDYPTAMSQMETLQLREDARQPLLGDAARSVFRFKESG